MKENTGRWRVQAPGAALVVALSGMGKSTLARECPEQVFDADELLYAAVAVEFKELEPRARLRAWRALCRSRPWQTGGAPLEQWACVRRSFIGPFINIMQGCSHPLVLTSLLHPPWCVSAYYGIERGKYLEHLRRAGRPADNAQSESMNDRLEGYLPLVRLPPGAFLGDQAEIRSLL